MNGFACWAAVAEAIRWLWLFAWEKNCTLFNSSVEPGGNPQLHSPYRSYYVLHSNIISCFHTLNMSFQWPYCNNYVQNCDQTTLQSDGDSNTSNIGLLWSTPPIDISTGLSSLTRTVTFTEYHVLCNIPLLINCKVDAILSNTIRYLSLFRQQQ